MRAHPGDGDPEDGDPRPMTGDALLRDILRSTRGKIALAAAGSISHQACETLVPVFIGLTIDAAIAPSDGGRLALWLALLAVLFVVLSASFRLQILVGVRAMENAEHELRLRLTRRILDPGGIDLSGADGRASGAAGALLNIAGDDARQTVLAMQALVVAVGATSALVVSTLVLLSFSLVLGLIVLVGTPLLVAALHRTSRAVRSHSATEQAHAGDAAAVAADLVRGVRVLKGLGAEEAGIARYRHASHRSLLATIRAARAESVLEGANVLISGVLLVVVALVGARMALDGTITIGQLIAAVGLTQFLIGPLLRIGFVVSQVAQARASAERAAAVLAAAPAVADGARLPRQPAAGRLRLEALRLPRSAGELALDVQPGEHLGLVIADPADAVGLLDVLARRGDPAGGEVTLDGIALAQLPLADSHRLLLVADHDADLFDGSVAENVAATAPDLDDERRERILVACSVDEAVAALPGGLDAQVGERGTRLSGGQRQRIALARALAADPPVLVLHEPTTAVDAVTEARIAGGMRRLRKGRTTIVVASSPALLAVCDRVAVIADGAIVDLGTHDRLARDDARYRELVLQ